MAINFDLNDLQAFRAVVEQGSFRKAADTVRISQPALSRRIEKLEEALGVKLFERTTRRVNLTQAGRCFMPSVERLLDDLDVALLGISEVASTRLGHVTVACVPSAAYYFMPRVIARYHQQFPRIKVKLLDSSAHDVLSAVINGEADFGLSFMGSLEAKVDFEPLVQEGYVVACRRDHALAGRSSVTWDEFYQQDYISLDKTSGNRLLLDQALAGVVPQRPSICETRHVTTMIGLVEAGLGVAAVPLMAMPAADHPILTRVPLTAPQVMRSVGLIKRRGRTLTPAALALERLVVDMKIQQPTISD
ncbi:MULTISPECIES: LysR family transcriptional regulator [unclassified Pseudomonas]|uniref:LysR family transcriptional regulator n=1 Tax=unclassified Pseudomonas TaxID=196821 RepID=UPI002AC9DA75|nr:MULTISPECIES: LysR family transcriptional regulator [unclassified Pseudomonas]MEB0045676.1 LysR family transcriptional regulator [Pseudomonas sp. Dout3]MEB0095559.1 LysR family transcriptional regulator [Pseudomonas sp. DC1.2]WPX61140.1 LysR family transcriptional regulator [Pseudomonas sp. DC1.2]